MIPVSLTLRNFLSYGDEPQTLDFTQFRVACLTGDNGNGKSALLDAMTYALWGQARKGRHDRKPDDGLLRLGATHMSVEFAFDLDDDRYRVMRSFRRRPRSSVSELELQLFDPEADQFRPLTQAGAPSVTQGKIDDLLSMDYETFTNSAYLRQGHADAFTRKSPRERKQLLGRILGVDRYDRLQELARRRLTDLEDRMNHLTRKVDDASEALATRSDVDWQVEQVGGRLDEASKDLASAEQALARLQDRAVQAKALRAEQDWDTQNERDLTAALERLTGEELQLQEQMQQDSRLVEQASSIEADADQLAQCQELLQDSQLRRTQVMKLRQREQEARAQIEAARQKIEQSLARWHERHTTAIQTRDRLQDLIDQEAGIEAAWLLVSQARDQVARQREHRRASDELARRRQGLENQIDITRQRLQERASILRQQNADIESQLQKERPQLSQMRADAETAANEASARVEERRVLAEAGIALKTQIEKHKNRQENLADELERLSQRRQDLGQADSKCPVCETELDAEHRFQIAAEYDDQQSSVSRQLADVSTHMERMQIDVAEHRRKFSALASAESELTTNQQHLAFVREREASLRERERVGHGRQEEFQEIDETLRAQAFCATEREQVLEVQTLMSQIDYHPEHLEQAELAAGNTSAETRKQQLHEARQQQMAANQQIREAIASIESEQSKLSSVDLSSDAQATLTQIRAQISAADIDEDLHARQMQQVAQLQRAPMRLAQLQTARSRQQEAEDRVLAHRTERTRIRRRQRELAQRQADRVQKFAQVDGIEQACAAATEVVTLRRGERDGLIERRGALRTRSEHLAALATQTMQNRQERKLLQAKAWLHEQLVEAFGKDGIQALIIEHAIPEIEEEANAILRRLTDNRIQIAIESIRDLKSGGSRETLDIKISDEIGERGYDMYSGGEAFRSDFALRLALSKVLARRAGTQLRTLIIDEGFGTQDSHGLEQLKDSINIVCADFDKVIIVTHLDELKSAFPTQIEVTKPPGRGSEFEIRHLA